jgi:galactonate dehydratase
MQIIDIEPVVVHVNQRGDWVFVQVHTDAGITGLGEASHSGNDALCLAVLNVFKQQLIGKSPFNINDCWQRLERLDGGRIARTALSGVEQALWDILGQHLGVPIHGLLGGALRKRVRLYANINRHVRERSPEGFARAARQAVAEGFTAIKLAPFDELGQRDHTRTGPLAAWQPGVARVRAVRQAIGDNVELAVDCHGRMEASEALLVAEALADCRLFWYEEPVHCNQIEDLAHITWRAPMPTASGETLFGLSGFRPFLTRRVVDVLMPDVKHDGGLLQTRHIAEAARMHDMLVAPHNPSGPVANVASGHVSATLRNFYILEYAWGEVDWRADLLLPREPVEDGHLLISDAPGLGYQLNPEIVAAHRTHQVTELDSARVQPG